MIHDVLLSCLNLHSDTLPLEDILASQAVSELLHPCEKKILEDIIAIINSLRNVAKFAKVYGSNISVTGNSTYIDSDGSLQNGLYLKAFANGVEKVLDGFLDEIAELERRYLQSPTQTLLHIYQKLQVYEPLAYFLQKLIRGLSLQRLHGCAILSHVHKNLSHGDQRIQQAMKIILDSVNIVFFKHLSHWLLYAKIYDSYGEFFIQSVDRNSSIESEKGSFSGRQTSTTSEAGSSAYGDIWQYEICYNYLPYFLSSAWAEKVLFIGQTVLIFKVDLHKIRKHTFLWNKSDHNVIEIEDSLWNGKEHMYFGKIQLLLKENEHALHNYERVIDEIKLYVSTRLSEIALNQADLVKQLKTIKEYFLLGRGEIFLDFIRLTTAIDKDLNKDIKLREFIKSFETAAHNIGVSEILEQITLSVPKQYLVSGDDIHDYDLMQKVQLDYCINWPLHLLFSPKVMGRYNMIFRFLLLIKKTQYEMNMVWFRQTAESKLKQNVNPKLLHLRNQLMFFVNTLQYYIQVDVLESQFSILLNTINNKGDFEQIQKSHSIFQANILSLCFLLNEDTNFSQHSLHSTTFSSTHPVYSIFHDILNICEDFYTILDSNKSEEALNSAVDVLCERFGNMINQLLTMLVGLKAMPGTTALSQLLLRLDFNRWFSSENKLSSEQT